MHPARSETPEGSEPLAPVAPALVPPEQDAAQEPPWLTEALEPVLKFLRTAWAFTRSPARFCGDWVSGRQESMNPVAFIGTATALVVFAMRAVGDLTERHVAPTLFSQLFLALAPQLYYAQFGLVAHAVLRLLGSRRRWTSSVGVALFAGGIFPTMAMLLSLGVVLGVYWTYGLQEGVPAFQAVPGWARIVLGVLISGAFSAFFFTLARGLGAVHGVSRGRRIIALMAAVIITGLIARVAPLPTLQLVVGLRWSGPVPLPSFDLRF
jgi:hypothetical protein